MNPDYTPVPDDQAQHLPFQFTNAHWRPKQSGEGYTLFATWRNQLLWAPDAHGPWKFDNDDSLLDDSHLELVYHHLSNVEITVNNQSNLEGIYNDKRVRWSQSNNRWQYFNHQPVLFPETPLSSDDQDPDVSAVTALLQTTTESVSRTLAAVTPEQPETALPGALPDTPQKPRLSPAPPAPQIQKSSQTTTPRPLPSTSRTMSSSTSTKSLGSAPNRSTVLPIWPTPSGHPWKRITTSTMHYTLTQA